MENFGIIAIVLYVAFIVLMLVANWKIWSKAGFHGAWSLLLLVPVVNLIAYLYFAFAEWPIRRRLSGPEDFR